MIWFTSDEHYDHRNIVAYCKRPFADVDDMREQMIARHNALVGAEDDVWHLGDFCLNEKSVRSVLTRLRGRHHLVPGNHDACHPSKKGWRSRLKRYTDDYGFTSVVDPSPGVQQEMLLPSPLNLARLTHMPLLDPTAKDQRFPEYRPRLDSMRGEWLLHGHVHEHWKVRRQDGIFMLNVGVDVWSYAPVSVAHLRSAAYVGIALYRGVPPDMNCHTLSDGSCDAPPENNCMHQICVVCKLSPEATGEIIQANGMHLSCGMHVTNGGRF